MSSPAARAIGAAQRAASRIQGGQIIYQRGNDRVWIREATFGQSEFQVETSDVVRIEHTDRDFIFPAETLILGGRLATPQKGDRITVVEEEHDDGQVFEVLAPGGAQVYRLCDPHGHLIRVHAKRVQ
jgi:hypothetical protein